MSALILPPGAEPPPPPQDDLPEEIIMSLRLLDDGIKHGDVDVMRKKMNDTGDQVVYDLRVTLKHPISGHEMRFIVARLIPQFMKPDPNERPEATVPAPAANN